MVFALNQCLICAASNVVPIFTQSQRMIPQASKDIYRHDLVGLVQLSKFNTLTVPWCGMNKCLMYGYETDHTLFRIVD